MISKSGAKPCRAPALPGLLNTSPRCPTKYSRLPLRCVRSDRETSRSRCLNSSLSSPANEASRTHSNMASVPLPKFFGGKRRHVLLSRFDTSSAITESNCRAFQIARFPSRIRSLVAFRLWFPVVKGKFLIPGDLIGATRASVPNLANIADSLPSSLSRYSRRRFALVNRMRRSGGSRVLSFAASLS